MNRDTGDTYDGNLLSQGKNVMGRLRPVYKAVCVAWKIIKNCTENTWNYYFTLPLTEWTAPECVCMLHGLAWPRNTGIIRLHLTIQHAHIYKKNAFTGLTLGRITSGQRNRSQQTTINSDIYRMTSFTCIKEDKSPILFICHTTTLNSYRTYHWRMHDISWIRDSRLCEYYMYY